MSDTWDYRVVRSNKEDGTPTDWYSIQEVYYDDETGEPMAQTLDLQIEQDTIAGMRTQLEQMLQSLEEPVLDESDIVDDSGDRKTVEERVLDLETENEELNDRLNELRESVDEFRGASKRHGRVSDLSGEEIDGMYTDDELEEWGMDVKKKDNKRQEKTL